MITDITPEKVLDYLDREIKALQVRLVSKYGEVLLSNGGLAYYVDEEDDFLEYLSHEMGTEFADSDEVMIQVLNYWKNERKTYPREWIIWAWNQLIKEENEVE
jgi:hypothetical protein